MPGRNITTMTVFVALVSSMSGVAGASAAEPEQLVPVGEVRSTYTSEFGVARPGGIAYVERDASLVIAGSGTEQLVEISRSGDLERTARFPGLTNPEALVYDNSTDSLVAFDGTTRSSIRRADLGSTKPSVKRSPFDLGAGLAGATIDPRSGDLVVLSDGGSGIDRVDTANGSVDGVGTSSANGDSAIAVNPNDQLVYVMDGGGDRIRSIDNDGTVVASYDVSSVGFGEVRSMVFAPSADATDPSATQNLFVVDAGTADTLGRVVEVSLAAPSLSAAAAAPVVYGSLVRTVATSQWNPGSPDPSGIVYLPGPDRLQIVDSEVNEQTGAGYHGVNMWQVTRAGVVTDTGTSHPAFSSEPTGLGAKTSTNPGVLFISDDDKDRISVDDPGPDKRFGTADDVVTFINTFAYGSKDAEDPEFDPSTGDLFFLDGVNTEVYRINPVDGIFGNGNDTMTHFDVGVLGSTDFEGLSSDPSRGTLLVAARKGKVIYEVTKSGSLVTTINLSALTALKYISGVALAPASNGSGNSNIYIVDRAVDNGANPSENDGKMFEVSYSLPNTDSPPTVAWTAPASGANVRGSVSLQASASDDRGVASVAFAVDGSTIGTDTNGADGWSMTWASSSVADGSHSLMVTATDTVGQTATDTRSVTVDNTAPSVAVTAPSSGQQVAGNQTLAASASDAIGLASVTFRVDGTPVGVDTNGSNGWSVAWASASVANGAYTVSAEAADIAGNTTASAPVSITVNNTVAGGVIDQPIVSGSDDVEEQLAGGIVVTSTDLDMMIDRSTVQAAVGLRFSNLTIPVGATITRAYIQFEADEVSTEDITNLEVAIQDSTNAPAFITAKRNLTSRALRPGAVAWSPPAWLIKNERGTRQATPDLASMIQGVVGQTGWAPGNALVFSIKGSGSGSRVAEASEGTGGPVLHIEYS